MEPDLSEDPEGTSSETTARLADVALRARVSLATASRALNGSSRTVTEDLRRRVTAAAAELRYSPNAQAQAVARGRSDVVALVVGDVADPYFATIAAGVIAEAARLQLVVMMAVSGHEEASATPLARHLRAQRPRAVVLAGSPSTSRDGSAVGALDVAGLRADGVGVAGIRSDSGPLDDSVRAVLIANRSSAQALAEALVSRGYRRFVVLAGPAYLVTARERSAGFTDAAERGGAVVERIVESAFTRDGGFAAMRRVIADGLVPECVFAATDVMAVGAMTAMRDAGLQPGADIAIAGFDDIAMLQDVVPALSTVRLPLEEIGRRALRIALDPDAEPEAVFAGTVELRDSTPPRSAEPAEPGGSGSPHVAR